MSVNEHTPLNTYTGDGALTTVSFSFPALTAADVKAKVNGVELAYNVDYTVDIVARYVTFTVAPANGASISVYRSSTLTRAEDYQTAGDFRAPVVNADFDRLWLVFNELINGTRGALSSLRVPAGETISELAARSTRANKSLGFDSNGDPTVLTPVTGTAADVLTQLAASAGSSMVGFTQGAGAVTRTVQARLREAASITDYGALPGGASDCSAAFTAALAQNSDVFVPPGTWGVGAMIEIGTQKRVHLAAGATVVRKAALSASQDPVFWLKGIAAGLTGAGRIASTVTTENRCPRGVVRIGHKDLTESHANVTYCTLADLQVAGAVDFGQTTGAQDVAVYMPNPEIGGLASYFHSVRSLRVSSVNVGIWLHGHANANSIFDITGQDIGNVTLGGSMLSINGAADNRISGCFFHQSPNTAFIAFADEGAIVPSMNSLTDMVCEQGGGPFLRATGNAISNYVQGLDNTATPIDVAPSFLTANTLITREKHYTQESFVTKLNLAGSEIGTWTNVTYAAGDFAGSGSMTWTVDSGDVQVFAYTIIGKTMTIAFSLSGTSVGGTVSNNLLLKIPASKTPKKGGIRSTVLYSDNGTAGTGVIVTVANDTQLAIQKPAAASWTLSANNTTVQGQITFEIN